MEFSPATQAWFAGAYEGPTPAQAAAWTAIAAGRDTLVVAPTGSGKTLAAFLWSLDQIAARPIPSDPALRCRVLYISPLKALAVDVERNLRQPLAGIERAARSLGLDPPEVTVGVRTGDTPADERRRLARRPPDLLITTPESLYLMLTSAAREGLRGVEAVIVDEVHAVAGTKRGAHLALSLERLDAFLGRRAQRIGLSATVRPVDEVARFLGGVGGEVEVVRPPSDKRIELSVVVPVADLAGDLGAGGSVWPHVEERIVDLVEAHRSTLVFANSRRLAERLCERLNAIASERAGHPYVLARAHHGSVSRDQRALIEAELKAGRLPAVVATSTLELGIDMGAIDLVVQVESPPSVASGLQRVGRAGHQVGAVSRGVVFPKHRGDLVPTAVVAERMAAGALEALAIPRNPLDVLAQQIVAMVALDDWPVDGLLEVVRRAAPFAQLPASAYEGVLDLLAGRYPSDEFAELRPRLVWDRAEGMLRARPGAQRLAVTSGGTIPDRGLFGVFLAGDRPSRVGELDEEMVYESRVGDVFTLGSSAWRVEQITHDRVVVSPAPGEPSRLPFWHGDALGRPAELGAAIGAFTREVAALPDEAARARVAATGLDPWAADNLLAYLRDQQAATGVLPDDRTIVVERFRDEIGDWRVAVHSPYGAQVHAPWALALAAQLRETRGAVAQIAHADDGLVLRLPDADDPGVGVAELLALDPDVVERLVADEAGGSALFAARFRESSARALLLPRRDPRRRTPLWQQRQRSAHLLAIAARHPQFPMALEAMREVLQDVYDLPALVDLCRRIQSGEVRIVEVETAQPSPYARSLVFGYVAAFLYEGDTPLAERRAQALALDSTLLAELLGRAELRDLLDGDVIARAEADLQWLSPDRHARDAEGAADLLRLVGPLTTAQAAARGVEESWLAGLARSGRVIQVRVAGERRWAAVEDAARLRDALGTRLPAGVPDAFRQPVADPLEDLIARHARTHGPFTAAGVAAALGLGPAVARDALDRLAAQGRVVEGEFRPGGAGAEWCDAEVLRLLRRRSLAALRKEVEPVAREAYGRFLPAWHGIAGALRGSAGVLRAVEQLEGVALPASAWEALVLPARVADYSPAMLDELTSAGEVLWCGRGALPGGDGRVSLHPAGSAALSLPFEPGALPGADLATQVRAALDDGRALFFRPLSDAVGSLDDAALAEALWSLVWAGVATNDTLAPLRARLAGRGRSAPASSARTRYGRPGRAPLPSATGGPLVAGRWSLLPARDPDPTLRAHALAERLLDRHGVVTRGALAIEDAPGGFAAAYRVLTAFEDAGRCRRAYAIEGLGAAQFAAPGAVDRLRAGTTPGRAVLLAAADPANPYGAALPWPAADPRPARKAGAAVVLVEGAAALFVERGGKSLLTLGSTEAALRAALAELARGALDGALGALQVQRVDGVAALASPHAPALEAAGFRPSPGGLRLRR